MRQALQQAHHSLGRYLVGLALLLGLSAPLNARPRGLKAEGGFERQLRKHLIPPRLVLRHMDELKLSEAQSAQLKALMKEAQSQQLDAQFERKGASQALIEAVQDPQKPEAEVLKLADALMQVEAKQKRARLQTALKVRALLSPEQRQQVMDLKGKLRDRIKERRAQEGGRWGRKGRKGRKGRRERSSESP